MGLEDIPLSELHEKMKIRNNGKMLNSDEGSIVAGHEIMEFGELKTPEECEQAYCQAIRTPWHEYVRRSYDWLFGR